MGKNKQLYKGQYGLGSGLEVVDTFMASFGACRAKWLEISAEIRCRGNLRSAGEGPRGGRLPRREGQTCRLATTHGSDHGGIFCLFFFLQFWSLFWVVFVFSFQFCSHGFVF